MNKKTYFKCFNLAALLTVLFCSPLAATPVAAVGQITTPIVISNAMRGEEITVDLYFVNSDNVNGKFILSAGGKTGEFTSFYEAADKHTPLNGEFSLAANARMQAVAVFKIPSDIPNGTYSGVINIKSIPLSLETGNKDNISMSVGQIISRAVTITVSDKESISATVSIIPSKYTYSVKENLDLKINVRNESNVSIKPNVHFNIAADGNSVFDAIFPYSEAKEAIHPGTTITLDSVKWRPMDEKIGNYVATVEVLVKDKAVGNAVIPFSVVAEKDLFLANALKALNIGPAAGFGCLIALLGAVFLGFKVYKNFAARPKKNNPIL